MSGRERKSVLRAELIAAARALHEADEKAHKDAWRCPRCRCPDTMRIHEAEALVLMRARALAHALGASA